MIESQLFDENEKEIAGDKYVDRSPIEDDFDCLGVTDGEQNALINFDEIRESCEIPPEKGINGGNTTIDCEKVEKEGMVVGGNIDDIFNKIHVKNMVEICVSKLNTEYERTTCQRVASVENITDVTLDNDSTGNNEDVMSSNKVLIIPTILTVNSSTWYFTV